MVKAMRKINYLVGVLFVAALLCIVPVSALPEVVSISSNAGGIASSFSMSITGNAVSFPLTIGTVEKTTGTPAVHILTNAPYTLKARDEFTGNKPEGSQGHMAGMRTTGGLGGQGWILPYLTNAFEVGINGNSYVPMTAVDQNIRILSTGEDWTGDLKFRQVVTSTDPVLPTDQIYLINIVLTGSN
jgi:hypothetical protein